MAEIPHHFLQADWDYDNGEPIAASERPEERHDDGIPGVWFDGDTPPAPVPTIVDGMIPARGVTFLGGQSGSGKTFVAIDLGVALATDGTFFGKATEELLGVIYVAAEGRDTISARLAAAKIGREITGKIPFAVIRDVPNLTEQNARRSFNGKLQAVAARLQEQFGARVGVVIVDTLAAAFSMKDENSAAEMNTICKAAAELGDAVGAATLVIVHYGKDASTGIRGSSASRAAGESILAALADRDEIKGETKNRRLVKVKSRDGVEGETTRFELEHVHLGCDDKGRSFGAAKVVLLEGKVEAAEKRLSRGERVYLDALTVKMDRAVPVRPFGAEGPQIAAVDRDIVRDEFYAAWPADGDTVAQKTEAKRKAFNRSERSLLDREMIATREIGCRQMIWLLDDTPDATASKNSTGHAEQPDEQGD